MDCNSLKQCSVELCRLPAPNRTEAVFDLYRELFGEGEVAVVHSIFTGQEQEFSRDWIACADLGNGTLGGSAMGSQSLDYPELGALNGVAVRQEARGRKIAENCCRSILETLDASGVRGTFLATVNPIAARLYSKLGFAFLPGTCLMLRCGRSGDDAYAFFQDFYPGGETGEISPGDASCRLMMPPLMIACRMTALDPLVSLWNQPMELNSCQGLFPRYANLGRRNGSWFQLRGANRALVAVGTVLPEQGADTWINVTAHPNYPQAEEKMWRFLLQYCREHGWTPRIPVPESLRSRQTFLESLGLSCCGKHCFKSKNYHIEYCLYA